MKTNGVEFFAGLATGAFLIGIAVLIAPFVVLKKEPPKKEPSGLTTKLYSAKYEGLYYDIAVFDGGVQLDIANGDFLEIMWMGSNNVVYTHRTKPLEFFPAGLLESK